MRISVDKRDRGHRWDIDMARVSVFLNGEPFSRAVTADEEEGLIIAHKYSENGRPVISEDGKSYVLETLRGKVRIEIAGDDGTSIRTPKVVVERKGSEVVVNVYSRLRSSNIRRMVLNREIVTGFNEEQLSQACGLSAGAAAEHLCSAFGDLFDPSEVAKAAIEACRVMLAGEASGRPN